MYESNVFWKDEDLFEIEQYGTLPPKLFIELPHGAVHREEYTRFADKIPNLPQDLIEFFFVNTDIGTPELGRAIANVLQDSMGIIILRSKIPRTFIDCNRMLSLSEEEYRAGKVTPAIPSYVAASEQTWLIECHKRYSEKAMELYDQVCGAGGFALMLHSYAPKSVGIDIIEADIVERLHWAYEPEIYKTWPVRPEIDIIAKTKDNVFLCNQERMFQIKHLFEKEGFHVGISETYPMHPATTAYLYAQKYPSQTLCIEVRRDILMQEFIPFRELICNSTNIDLLAHCIRLDF